MTVQTEVSVCIETRTLGYAADIHWSNGDREQSFLTCEERAEHTTDARMYSAVFSPLIACAPSQACAWLVDGTSPGPFITGDRAIALRYLDIGCNVTSLGRPQ
jgi:hypothetical protein